MERIAEIPQKFPACCRKDTFGLHPLCTEKAPRLAYGVAGLRYFKRGVVNLLPVGSDDDGNNHFGQPLRWRCRWSAASGVRLVPPDLPWSHCGYGLGTSSPSDRLVDCRDELCWLSLPATWLFGWASAKFLHCFRQTKSTRALASGSSVYFIGHQGHFSLIA